MLAEALRTLYGYNRWATGRLLDVTEQLAPEQFLAPGSISHGSVRDTLVHLVAAQRRWLSWWDGSLPGDEAYRLTLDPAHFPDLAAVRAVWEDVERQTQAFVAGLSDADAARDYTQTLPDGREWRMPLWQMMLHVANHGTQHRSEVATLLSGFGQSPGDLDLTVYLWTAGKERAGG